MVKTTTFNGIRLPSIAWYDPQGDRFTIVRTFGYEDYKNRLS
jgi:carboxynorspermidine decarboxylase